METTVIVAGWFHVAVRFLERGGYAGFAGFIQGNQTGNGGGYVSELFHGESSGKGRGNSRFALLDTNYCTGLIQRQGFDANIFENKKPRHPAGFGVLRPGQTSTVLTTVRFTVLS
ncbi:hypothetical protein D3C71_1386740 [compost metagenome]